MPLRMIEFGPGVQRTERPGLAVPLTLDRHSHAEWRPAARGRNVGDNVIAILAHLRDDKEKVHKIVGRIAGMTRAEREIALAQLTILAGLRHLARTVEQETKRMPIDLYSGKGLQVGMERGLQKGLQQGELTILRRQIEKRFGALPKWAGDKLAALSASQLEDPERAGSGREQRGRIAKVKPSSAGLLHPLAG
jgi:hypothetical protein